MADTSNSTPASDENPNAFNPADWLSRFEMVGGGFLATKGQTSLCIACQGSTRENQSAAHTMLRHLTDDQRAAVITHIRDGAGLSEPQPDLNAIPLERLSEPAGNALPSGGDALDQPEGSHSMDMTHAFTATAPVYLPAVSASGDDGEFQSALKAWTNAVSAIESHSGDEDIPRDLCDAQSATWRAMLDTPAPDLAALRFKLERLLQVEPAVDAINAWDGAEVRQTLEDIARLMGGLVIAAAQTAFPDPDQEIESEWRRWNATFARYNALPHGDPEEKRCWGIIDEAEEAIRSAVAKTPAGAAIQIKVALHRMLSQRDDVAALMAGDLDHLENAGLDWTDRLVLAALRSLETQAPSPRQMDSDTSFITPISAYLAELDALDALGRLLDDLPSSEGDRWERWSIRLWGEIEALPVTPDNAQLKARAVWSIMGGEMEELGEGSTCCRLVRQIVTSFGNLSGAAAPSIAAAAHARAEWDQAYHQYRCLKLRSDAYYALGPMKWANNDHSLARACRATDLEAFEKAQTRLTAEEAVQDNYYQPADDAAIVLIKMPAPDLDAVAIKVQLHKDHLENCEGDREAWGFIDADLCRLGGMVRQAVGLQQGQAA